VWGRWRGSTIPINATDKQQNSTLPTQRRGTQIPPIRGQRMGGVEQCCTVAEI